MTNNNSFSFYYAGIIILFALIFGGGTTQGLWTDHLLQILLIPALFIGLNNLDKSKFSFGALCFLFIILSYFALQFFPIAREIRINGTDELISGTMFSLSPQKSLETVLYGTTVLGFSIYLSRFTDVELGRLIRFFLIGLAVNLILAALQLSYSGTTNIDGYLPYTIRSATFANENHFSTLAFSIIPLLAFHYLVRIRRPIIFLIIAFVISIILFAVGSRAGMTMTIAISAVCFFWFTMDKITTTFKILSITILFVTTAIITYFFIGLPDMESIMRDDFTRNTFMAFKDNYLFGTGLGSFVEIYPSYEPLSETRYLYVNHAHNEYVELLLETGLIGAILFSGFALLITLGFGRSKLSQASGLGIFAIAAHSFIDYPLRTMAIAILFAFYISVLFSNKRDWQQI